VVPRRFALIAVPAAVSWENCSANRVQPGYETVPANNWEFESVIVRLLENALNPNVFVKRAVSIFNDYISLALRVIKLSKSKKLLKNNYFIGILKSGK